MAAEAQQGFGSWVAFGEQAAYDIPLESWAELWQKKYELVSVGLREESTPIVPQRIRATRSPIPNVRGRVMVSGGISVQSHPQDLLPWWKEATMSRLDDIVEEIATEATLTAATVITASTVALVAPVPLESDRVWLGAFASDAAAKTARDGLSNPKPAKVAYWSPTASHVRITDNAGDTSPTWSTEQFSTVFGQNQIFEPTSIADSAAEIKTYLDTHYNSKYTYYIYDDATADDLRKVTYTPASATVGVKGPVDISYEDTGATLLGVDIQPEDAEDASFGSSILNASVNGSVFTAGDMYSTQMSPARLKITLTDVELSGSATKAYIGVFGLDQNNVPISELLEVDAGDIVGDDVVKTTKNYYKKVGAHPNYAGAPDLLGRSEFKPTVGNNVFNNYGIQIVNFAATSGSTSQIRVETVTNRKRNIFRLRNPLLHGNTFYVQKGVIPNSYFGVMFNSTTFQFGETCQVDVDVLGRNGLVRVPIDQPLVYGMEQGRADLRGPADSGRQGRHDAWSFESVEDEAHPGWEGGIQIREYGSSEWVTIPCTDISVVINNNLSHPERYWFNRYHVKPTATDVREVMVNATVDYETRQGLDFQFKENLPLEARIIAFFKGHANEQLKTQVTLPKVQLNSTVDPEVSDNGPITQSFDLKCIPTDANAGNEMIVTVEGTKVIGDLAA